MELHLETQRIQRAKERHVEQLRQANIRRLLNGAGQERSRQLSIRSRAMLWFGTRLVVYGKRLQQQYG